MAGFSDTRQQRDLKILEKKSLLKKKPTKKRITFNENCLKHKLLNANTMQETKMVKGSLHFPYKDYVCEFVHPTHLQLGTYT